MRLAVFALGLWAAALPARSAAADQAHDDVPDPAALPADRAPGPAGPGPVPLAAGGGLHWTVGLGGFAGLTGPSRYGPAAELQVYPGGRAGRLGAALRYRGFAGWSSGMATAGVVYAAGAARPLLVLEIHGEVGMAYNPRHLVAGGGGRVQIGLWGPLTVALDTSAHLIFDGLDTRLAIAPGLLLGLSR